MTPLLKIIWRIAITKTKKYISSNYHQILCTCKTTCSQSFVWANVICDSEINVKRMHIDRIGNSLYFESRIRLLQKPLTYWNATPTPDSNSWLKLPTLTTDSNCGFNSQLQLSILIRSSNSWFQLSTPTSDSKCEFILLIFA